MVMAIVQKEILPDFIGFDNSMTWIIALAVGIALGAAIGGGQGFLIAFLGIPAFIVTLGGMLVWRGGAFLLASGRTIAPLDQNFSRIGGGTEGSLGRLGHGPWHRLGHVELDPGHPRGRRSRRARGHGSPTPPGLRLPDPPDVGRGHDRRCRQRARAGCGLGRQQLQLAHRAWQQRYAETSGIEVPDGGLFLATGIAYPVLIMIAVAAVMTWVARRRQFGRYVYAIGGNPEAAELSGINVRRTLMLTFALMGVLVAISAAITSGRLDAATNALGQWNELFVIAAAVIGGTSFAGGIGTIPGAILGALFMQTLQSGMVLIGFDTAQQNIVVGIVLVIAVGIDTAYRRRASS